MPPNLTFSNYTLCVSCGLQYNLVGNRALWRSETWVENLSCVVTHRFHVNCCTCHFTSLVRDHNLSLRLSLETRQFTYSNSSIYLITALSTQNLATEILKCMQIQCHWFFRCCTWTHCAAPKYLYYIPTIIWHSLLVCAVFHQTSGPETSSFPES